MGKRKNRKYGNKQSDVKKDREKTLNFTLKHYIWL